MLLPSSLYIASVVRDLVKNINRFVGSLFEAPRTHSSIDPNDLYE